MTRKAGSVVKALLCEPGGLSSHPRTYVTADAAAQTSVTPVCLGEMGGKNRVSPEPRGPDNLTLFHQEGKEK